MGMVTKRRCGWGACLVVLLCWVAAAEAVDLSIERPGEREYVRDFAGLVTELDEQAIRERADAVFEESGVPILVLTIESMEQYGAGNLRIGTYARVLFEQWGIDDATADDPWHRGILLLVARDDQRAHIELGPGWDPETERTALRVLNEQILPRFEEGAFSAGVVAGVRALEAMARDEPLPRRPMPIKRYILIALLAGLAIFTVVSLARHGSVGWAWLFWGAVLAAIGYVLWQVVSSSRVRRARGKTDESDDSSGSSGAW